MAVPCNTCGRTYDVALFQFGRTIHCTCGSRVAMEPRRAAIVGEPRFLADAMLGALARWLRILGYDTAWESDVADSRLARRAIGEDRIVLTRDRRLPEEWRIPRVVVIDAESLPDQIREVVRRLALDLSRPLFLRCTRCNAVLRDVPRESVRAEVPERVFGAQQRFVRCPECSRVYWEGSHTDRMRRRLEAILGG